MHNSSRAVTFCRHEAPISADQALQHINKLVKTWSLESQTSTRSHMRLFTWRFVSIRLDARFLNHKLSVMHYQLHFQIEIMLRLVNASNRKRPQVLNNKLWLLLIDRAAERVWTRSWHVFATVCQTRVEVDRMQSSPRLSPSAFSAASPAFGLRASVSPEQSQRENIDNLHQPHMASRFMHASSCSSTILEGHYFHR